MSILLTVEFVLLCKKYYKIVCQIHYICYNYYMEKLKEIIADNLKKYRKNAKLTQAELAEKLNYSDKAVSKWERGETIPDVYILKQLAEIYELHVDDFLVSEVKVKRQPFSLKTALKNKHTIISMLAGGIVWLIATVVFVTFSLLHVFQEKSWLVFIYAIPVFSIVCLIFSMIWGRKWISGIFVSSFIWTAFLALYLSIELENIWLVFMIAVPLQILAILWFFLLKTNKKIKKQRENVEKQDVQ